MVYIAKKVICWQESHEIGKVKATLGETDGSGKR